MIRHIKLEPRFVKGVPRDLEPGVLYVSMEYGTVVHSCCCGCGHEVVTPLTPTDWRLTFDGETISLWPSVGNWNLPCRSHYVIKCNRVIEAGPLDRAKIEAEQKRDKAAKAMFYAETIQSPLHTQDKQQEISGAVSGRDVKHSLWATLRRWFG